MNIKTSASRAMHAHLRWIVIADANGLRLLSGSRDDRNQIELAEVASLKHEVPVHQRTRPSPLGDKSGHAYASTHHQDEEDLRRFAHQAAEWLEDQMGQHHIKAIALFAPPPLLGALRHQLSDSTIAIVVDHPLELASLTLPVLARHPRVRSCWPA